MRLTINAGSQRTQTTPENSAEPGNQEQECHRPQALLPRDTVQSSQLVEKREKKNGLRCLVRVAPRSLAGSMDKTIACKP